MNCLTGIVGLTMGECPCLGDVPSGYLTSPTGHYLDEMVSPYLYTQQDCDSGVWDKLKSALDTAAVQVYGELNQYLGRDIRVTTPAWSNIMGSSDFNGQYTGQADPTFTFTSSNIKGLFMRINSIGICSITPNVTKSVVINRNGQVYATILNVPTSGGGSVMSLSQDITLPLDGSTYEFSYDKSGIVILQQDFGCNCGGKKDALKYFISSPQIEVAPYFMNGFRIGATMECKTDGFVCDMVKDIGVRQTIGTMIQARAASIAMNKVLALGNLSAYTAMSNADFRDIVIRFDTIYKASLGWLMDNYSPALDGSACYSCDSNIRIASRWL